MLFLGQDYRTVQKSEPECFISGWAQLPEEISECPRQT